tara:strand:- start:45 stop:572 length:528 start_codon:yes stop_codon:yes gene_type:complete
MKIEIKLIPDGLDLSKEIQDGTPVDKMQGECPAATQDLDLNLENRQNAIDEYGYGPLNPNLDDTGKNDSFWQKIADTFNASIEAAKDSRCGNCAAFNLTSRIKDCIAKGIGMNDGADPYASVDAGDIGYCQFIKFKCASMRVCNAWVSGGPITDGKINGDGNDYAPEEAFSGSVS